MNAEEVEEKQRYMREQILESGYDPEDFIEFLHQYINSEQTPNMQQFSMKQIQKIVTDYKRHCKDRQKPQNQSKQDSYQNQSVLGQQQNHQQHYSKLIESKKVRIQYEKYAPVYDYEVKGFIPCIQSETLAKTIQITIPDMQTKQIEGYLFGIGSKTQYFYHIKTNLIKGTVKRLSEDFDWLNATLSRLYPFLALPQLQPLRKDLKDPYLKRQKDIEEYMQYLAKKSFLLTSHLFIDFVTISVDKVQKYKKTYDSMGFAKGVSLLKFPDGHAPIQLTSESRQFHIQAKQFCRKTSKIHESISGAIQKMIQSYRVAVSDTYTVVDLFAQLYDTYNDISNKFPQLKRQDYGDALVNLNNLFVGLGDSLKNNADLMEKHAKEYYRFTLGFDKNISKLIKNVREIEIEYLDFKYNLHRKKERVISDPSKWQIDSSRIDVKKLSKDELLRHILPKQTLIENDMKNWYAFSLKNEQIQFNDYLRLNTHRYYKIYKTLAKQLLVSDKNYLEALTKFIGECRRGSE